VFRVDSYDSGKGEIVSSGLWLSTKRIESGTVNWPKDEAGAAEMNGVQLRLLLQGVEIRSRRGWYRRGTGTQEMNNL
jgi:IS66 Orf2 like protein